MRKRAEDLTIVLRFHCKKTSVCNASELREM